MASGITAQGAESIGANPANLGLSSQRYDVFTSFATMVDGTPYEHVAAAFSPQGALDFLDRVGLSEQALKPSGVLAHGDQRRLELAIALAGDPRLLMLDEPTAGMAPRERHEIMELVARIGADTGLTIVFTEHDMDVVFAVAAHITVLHQGWVIAEGRPQEVRANQEVQRIYLGQQVAGLR